MTERHGERPVLQCGDESDKIFDYSRRWHGKMFTPNPRSDGQRRRPAARIHSEVANHDPSEVVDATPALSPLVADRSPGFKYAVYALNQVAGDHPREVRPAARDLADVIADSSLNVDPRVNASAALGKVASEFPDAAVSRIADTNSGTVEQYTDQLTALLDHDHRLVRLNACWAISHLQATAAASRLRDFRTADDEAVRKRAAWALSELEPSA